MPKLAALRSIQWKTLHRSNHSCAPVSGVDLHLRRHGANAATDLSAATQTSGQQHGSCLALEGCPPDGFHSAPKRGQRPRRNRATIPADIATVRKGIMPKDTIQKLKQIEKLSKRLRSELNP
jgi:hypothetical protein